MPVAAASVYFLVGMCQGELDNPATALEAFNNSIKVNPQYAEVWCNLKLVGGGGGGGGGGG